MTTPQNEKTIETIEKPNKTQFTSDPNSISSQLYAERKNVIEFMRNYYTTESTNMPQIAKYK